MANIVNTYVDVCPRDQFIRVVRISERRRKVKWWGNIRDDIERVVRMESDGRRPLVLNVNVGHVG